jgi:hypothetical protein
MQCHGAEAFLHQIVGQTVALDLRDGGVLILWRIDLETLWLAHDTGGQLHDVRRKSSAEHHGLATLQRELVDFGQVIGKAEVQHAV